LSLTTLCCVCGLSFPPTPVVCVRLGACFRGLSRDYRVPSRAGRPSRVGPTVAPHRLFVKPGLEGRVLQRRFPIGDALLVARVPTSEAAAVAGATPAGTERLLDQLIERKTASNVVSSLHGGRLGDKTYYMTASGRYSLTCIVDGDLAAATENKAEMCTAVETFLATLIISTPFFIKHTGRL